MKNIGFIVKDSDLHICGYEGIKVIVQLKEGENTPTKKLKLYKNTKGEYFNLEGKRMYLTCESGLFSSNKNKVENEIIETEENQCNLKRTEIIKRYENIKSRWDNDKDLIRILPEVYEDICRILEGLKVGAEFKIIDRTQELKIAIAYVGGQIPRCNFDKNGLINVNNGIKQKDAITVAKMF